MTQPHSHRFLGAFPPPEFLRMPAVGISITDNAVRFIELVYTGGRFTVSHFAERKLPSGAIVEGYVKDKAPVVKVLSALKDEFKFSFASISLPEQKAYIFKTQLPRLLAKEVRGALELRLEENVPFPASETVFDYTISNADNSHDHLDISVAALPAKAVSVYVAVAHDAGIVPVTFLTEAQAVARAVVEAGDKRTILVVNIGDTQTVTSVVEGGILAFTSSFPIGIETLVKDISKRFSILPERTRAFLESPEELTEAKNEVTATDFSDAFSDNVRVLRDEIEKVITYWQTRKEDGAMVAPLVEEIVLVGVRVVPWFVPYLTKESRLPTSVANIWRNVFSFDDYIPPIISEESLRFVAAVGLAIPPSAYLKKTFHA